MKKTLFLFFLLLGIGICGEAYAGDASPIFDSLAEKAAAIGKGLRYSGFLIAGFGLIVFSFMAIFNKISWKMLAYIMFSTFILSTMVGVIGYISNGQSNARFMDIQSTGAGGESMDPTQAQVGKDGGSPQYGNGTAPYKAETVDTSGSAQQYAAQNQAALDQRVESYMQNGQQQQQQEQQQEQEPQQTEAEKKAAFEAEVKGEVQRELMARNVTGGLTDVKSSISMAENGNDPGRIEKFASQAQDALNYLQSLPPEKQTDYVKNQIKIQQQAVELYNKSLEKMKSKGQ